MAPGPPVEFGGVFVVRETETALLCRIGEKFHWVAHSRLQPGSTRQRRGTSPLNAAFDAYGVSPSLS